MRTRLLPLGALGRRVLAPAPAARPALLRALTGAFTAVYLARRTTMLGAIHRSDPQMFAPVGPCRVLRRPLPPRAADALVRAELIADVAFTLGVCHRVVGPLHAGLLLWTLSYRNSWSMIFHNDNNLVLHTMVLGTSRSADALSADAVLRRHSSAPLPDWRYGLPSRLVSAVTVATYLVSGVAKVRGPLGWSWAKGESLRSQVAADGLRKELLGSTATPFGVRLYSRTRVFTLLAAGSLALELGAPLALLDRRLGQVWALGAFAMHWGIRAVMGIRFRHHESGILYASFFPLSGR